MRKRLNVGDCVSISNAFACEDVETFASVSQDTNTIHLDETAAAESIFGQRVVHGTLVVSLFSALLGVQLPGEGTSYCGLTLRLKLPVFINEQITAYEARCVNDKGVTVIDSGVIVRFAQTIQV